METKNELVQKIHTAFYTEVDKLLKEATKVRKLPLINKALHDKADRLKKLGFGNASEVIQVRTEERISDTINWNNRANEKLKKAIKYFSFKYPHYKFITDYSINDLCNKYNLIKGYIHNYCGEVPDKNLLDIENFKIDAEDVYEAGFEIIAPAEMFRSNINDDPIVVKKVKYDGTSYYLIVTAWGLEASDELVVNERNN